MTSGFDIDAVSESLGGNKFDTDEYWSSSWTEGGNDDFANAFQFSSGNASWNAKNRIYVKVCAIREF